MKRLLLKMLSSQEDSIVKVALHGCKIKSGHIYLPNGWSIRAINEDHNFAKSITRTTIRMGPGNGNTWTMYRDYNSFVFLAKANQIEEVQQ